MTSSLQLDSPTSQKQLTYIADRVLSAKRLVFVSGAGISCSAGIPDFRSLHGLYDSAQRDNVKGQDLFDVSLFNNAKTTSLFYKFMAELRQKAHTANPTSTHRLLKTFKDNGSLLRSYTQNIDGLEARAGLNIESLPLKLNNVVQLHGDVHTLKCSLCSDSFQYEDKYMTSFKQGNAVECPTCAEKCAVRVALGRRSVATGILRPDIVLYGETHPAGERIARTCNADIKRKPDCLVIAGTSLKIPGLKRLIKDFSQAVHKQGGIVIFVNLTEVAMKEWMGIIDYNILGTSDNFVELLRTTRPAFFTKQVKLESCKTGEFASSKRTNVRKKGITKKPLMDKSSVANIHPLAATQDQEETMYAGLTDNKENLRPLKRKASSCILEAAQEDKRRVVLKLPIPCKVEAC